MKTKKGAAFVSLIVVGVLLVASESWTQSKDSSTQKVQRDAVQEAQTPKVVPITRPEQKKNEHDLKDIFVRLRPNHPRRPSRGSRMKGRWRLRVLPRPAQCEKADDDL